MGKIIGFLAGARYGGVWGAVVGLTVGHFLVDRSPAGRWVNARARALVASVWPGPLRRAPPCPHCRGPLLRAGDGIYSCPRCTAAAQGHSGRLGSPPLTDETLEPLDPYEVLGLDPRSATEEAIRTAHRELAKQYHPDRVAHLAPEFQELAARRFKAIQRAREQLLGERD
ncbi:MAG: DnaJ domain-containing protein [Planctomycetota bacterium]